MPSKQFGGRQFRASKSAQSRACGVKYGGQARAVGMSSNPTESFQVAIRKMSFRHGEGLMQTGLYVALSSQIALERRLTTIADNLANMNTVGFRATQLKFDDVLTRAEGTRVDYVSKGEEFVSTENGGLVQTGNPLDFATKGNTWFSIETPSGNAITRDGRFSMLESGALVTLEGYPVLDSGGGPITLNTADGPPTAS